MILRLIVVAGLVGSGLVAVTAPTAGAATITVSITTDTVDGGDGETSLREAFTVAGGNGVDDTIVLGAGLTYPLTDCPAGALAHAEDHLLTVQGNGSTVEQTCDATGIVDSSHHAGRLVLEQLTIDGGPNAAATAIEGAAVHAESQLELDTVEIRNVLSPGGSIVWSSFGHSTTPYRMVVADSNLHHNTGTVLTCDNCSARITGTAISDNTGSGISMVDGYPLHVEQSTIQDNTRTGVGSTGQGFPVNAMTIIGSTIQDNGRVGVRCLNCGQVTIDQTDVIGNGQTAVDALGGVALSLSQRDGVGVSGVGIVSSTIDGNRSTQAGGGLNVSPVLVEPAGLTATITLDQTSISGNESVGGGGGAWVGVGSLTSHQGAFDGNQTTGDGGGLYFASPAGPYDVSLDQTEVNDNTAGGRGAGFFADDVAAFQTTASDIDGNTATGDGGGIAVDDALSVVLDQTDVSGNSAANGGGMDLEAENVLFDQSTVDGNQATGTGGGARIDATSATLTNDTFDGNSAATGGSVAFLGTTTATLTHQTMADGTAATAAHISAAPTAQTTVSRSAVVLPHGSGSCAGPVTQAGFSVLADASCGGGTVTAADPQLAPLALSGVTRIRQPAPTSPLGGQVPVADCTVGHDQTSAPRPAGPNCDAGSVEFAETPASPAQAIQDLIADVQALDIPKWLETSLVLKLKLARIAVLAGNKPLAKALLTAFIIEAKHHNLPAPLIAKAIAIRSSL